MQYMDFYALKQKKVGFVLWNMDINQVKYHNTRISLRWRLLTSKNKFRAQVKQLPCNLLDYSFRLTGWTVELTWLYEKISYIARERNAPGTILVLPKSQMMTEIYRRLHFDKVHRIHKVSI